MRNSIKTLATLVLALGLVVAAIGPATATLSYDSETTDTTSTSDLTGGETLENLDSETNFTTVQIISDNATSSSLTSPEDEMTLEFTVDDDANDDDNYTFYVNDSAPTVVDETNGTYSWNLSHAAVFDEMPRDVDENVTVDVTATFNESETDEESATITFYAQNSDDRAVNVITDSDFDTESGVETVEEERTLRADLDYATTENDEEVTDNTTRVSYVFANDTVEEKYTDAYDVTSYDSEDYIWSMSAFVDGTPIMVFDSEAGEERDAGIFTGGFDPDEDSYATYDQDGGEYGENAQLDIYLGDDVDAETLELETFGNKKLGFYATLKNFGSEAARASGFGIAPESRAAGL